LRAFIAYIIINCGILLHFAVLCGILFEIYMFKMLEVYLNP
jgi:hypothetical protein